MIRKKELEKTPSFGWRFAFFIIGFFAFRTVTVSAQTATNVEQTLAIIHSNDLVFINATNSDPASNFAAAYAAYRQGKASKEVIMLLGQRAANAEPQDFYGKIVDQHDEPLSGVNVTGNLMVMGGLGDGAKNQTLITQSDTNGLFQFTGVRGWRLGVSIKKQGYTSGLTNGATGATNQNNREIFTMWKLQGAEPLVNINQRCKLHYTNAPINFDLLTGQIVSSGGDLKITVNRPPGVISGLNRQDWSVQIQVVDGGLIDSGGQEAVTYAAPESGYQPNITLAASANGHGLELIQQGLFVQSRNGQVYSKVGLSLRIDSDPDGLMNITLGGVANTNGSRNWEATVPQ